MKGKELLDKVADIVEETGIEERNEFWHRESSLYLAKKIVALLDYPSPPQDPEEAPASISDAELLEVVRKHLADVDQHGYIEGEDDVVAAKEITQFFHQYQHPKPVNDAELEAGIRKILSRVDGIFSFAAAHGVKWEGGDLVPELMQLFHSHHKALSLAQEAESKVVNIEVGSGVAGNYLSVANPSGGYRLAGPKPWGGGTTIHSFKVPLKLLIEHAIREAYVEHLTPTNKESEW
jgi:hypothetical protein